MNCSHEQIEGMLKLSRPEEREKLQKSIWKRRYSRGEADDELEKLESKATSRIPKFEAYWIIERPGTDGEELVSLLEYDEGITIYEIGEDG